MVWTCLYIDISQERNEYPGYTELKKVNNKKGTSEDESPLNTAFIMYHKFENSVPSFY